MPFVLKQDGKEKYRGASYNDCLVALQKLSPHSWSYSMKHAGWSIEEENMADKMKEFKSLEEMDLDEQFHEQVQKWLDRGDGVAGYENHDLGHRDLGHRQFVSFGSKYAQLEEDTPPKRLPDIGSAINWRYQLIGTMRLKKD